jgi:transposase
MTVKLTDDQWQKILPVLKTCPQVRLGAGRDVRRFLEAVLWVTRSGAQWRLLPRKYGRWNSVYKRFSRWSELRVFEKLFEHFSQDRDMEHLLIDSIIMRAHACAAGAQKRGRTKFREEPWRLLDQDSSGDRRFRKRLALHPDGRRA